MVLWPFGKKKKSSDPDDRVTEVWESNFGIFSQRRFPLESGEDYALTSGDRGLQLTLTRQKLFAWVTDPLFQYGDFILQATIQIDPTQGYGSGGFLLRQADEGNYYLFLISTRGQFRFDVIFNGHPKTLIPWTSFTFPWEGQGQLEIICRGDHFIFLLDGHWLGESLDDEVPFGRLALAAQTYEASHLEMKIRKIKVDSRPVEVETHYARWAEVFHPPKENRMRLAESLIAVGYHAEGVHQILSAMRYETLTRDELFLLAQGLIRQSNYGEGLRILEMILRDDPQWPLAKKEKAHILYAQNRFLDLKNFLLVDGEDLPEDEGIWNLLGHAHFHLGQWEPAERAYSRALKINPEMVIYRINRARSREKGSDPGAIEDYIIVARELFRQEAYEDLNHTFTVLESLAPGSVEVKSIHARVLFQQGRKKEAFVLLEEVCEKIEDAGAFYLLGLISKENKDYEKALKNLEKALSLEPDYYLFSFRLGEVKYLLGLGGTQEVWKALTLAPEDPWVWNLWGLLQPETLEKEKAFMKAREMDPGNVEVAINLADLWYHQGKRDEAWNLAQAFLPDPRVSNWQGNILSGEGLWLEAEKAYDSALSQDPENEDFLENRLIPLWKLEKYSKLEDSLIALLAHKDVSRFLIQLGDLAGLRGEYTRAEVSYWAAADLGDVAGLEALARHYLSLMRVAKLPPLIEKMKGINPEIADKWYEVYLTHTMDTIQCASCGLTWRAPKVLPDQGVVRLEGEIPDNAPAGRSPGTGKVYCVGCAQKHMENSRFLCPETGEFLKLQDNQLKWLLREIV